MEKIKIEHPGHYRLLAPIVDRESFSIGTIPAGTVIEITQVNNDYSQVIGPSLSDWIYQWQYVEPCASNVCVVRKES